MNRRWFAAMVVLAGSVALAAESGGILQNSSFEAPPATQASSPPSAEKWLTFAKDADPANLTLVTSFASTGKQSVRIASNKVANSFHGTGQAVAVKSGATYRFSVQVRNDPMAKLQGSVRGQISIEWQDSGGKEVDRTWGPDFGPGLSADKWTQYQMTGKAPSNAARANFVLTMHEGEQPGGGALLVDDATASQTP
jgi:hypothetical protein